MTIRPATSDDVAAMAEAWVASWEAAYRGVIADEEFARRPVARRVEQLRDQMTAAGTLLAAEQEGRVVGFCQVGPEDRRPGAPRGELYALYLAPEAWGHGLGSALLQAGMAALAAAGYTYVVLWVLADNPRARRFYERHGWQREGLAMERPCLGGSGLCYGRTLEGPPR